jgi:hypothetical protein
VHKGLALVPTTPIGVAAMEAAGPSSDLEEVKGLGENAMIFTFRLDDGSIIQMAVADDALALAPGPFAIDPAR